MGRLKREGVNRVFIVEREGPPANGPDGGSGGKRLTVLAGHGRPATSGQYRNRYIWRRGLPREAESSLLSGRGGWASGVEIARAHH